MILGSGYTPQNLYSCRTNCDIPTNSADAGVCYAYIEDLINPQMGIKNSRWFSRGWTLQELLAPKKVVFFGRQWNYLGTKASISKTLHQITGIEESTLLNPGNIGRNSIARRMSWASKRQTKRIEDVAYSLMGIFRVNMPLIYGEGENAFIRLQEEIMKLYDDQSIFAWEFVEGAIESRGLLARSPRQFLRTGCIVPIPTKLDTIPFSMTNRGLRIQLSILPARHLARKASLDIASGARNKYLDSENSVVGILQCQKEHDFTQCLGIHLTRVSAENIYIISPPHWDTKFSPTLEWIPMDDMKIAKVHEVYIRNEILIPEPLEQGTFILLKSKYLEFHGYEVVGAIECILDTDTKNILVSSRFTWDASLRTMHVVPTGLHDKPACLVFTFHNRAKSKGFAFVVLQAMDRQRWSIFSFEEYDVKQTPQEYLKSEEALPFALQYYDPPRRVEDSYTLLCRQKGSKTRHWKLTAHLTKEEIHNRTVIMFSLDIAQIR